jgi:hypothetical protein
MYSTVYEQYIYVQYSTRKEGNNARSKLITKIGFTNSVGAPDPVGPEFFAGSGLFIGSSIFNTRSRSGFGSDLDHFYYNHNSTSYSFSEINTLCHCELLIFYSKYLDGRPIWSDPDPEPPILKDRIRNRSIIDPVRQQ